MEKHITDLLTPEILEKAVQCFTSRPAQLKLLTDLENFVYECQAGTEVFILRLSHSSHRTIKAMKGELDWIAYLHARGCPVVEPIPSRQGTWIEVIPAGETHFLASAFKKILGQPILEAETCNPEVYRLWGRALGKMHALAKIYQPPPGIERPAWSENDLFTRADIYLEGQPEMLKKLRAILAEVHRLPKDRDSYGLIHADLTDVNFFYHDGKITIFDFDDSEYHWFAYDIALILFDSVPWMPHRGMSRAEFGRSFYEDFMTGYQLENTLKASWLGRIPLFMRLRDILLFIFFHKKWDLENLTLKQEEVIQKYKKRIEKDGVRLDIDYSLNP